MNHNEMPRRNFLADGSKCVALSLAFRPRALAQVSPGTNPFTLGVASGDPLPDGVVLWTRLAPDPLVGGGMPAGKVEVEWLVADDEHMSKIVQRGRATASPDLGHSVHVEVQGLKAIYPMDQWAGYEVERNRVLGYLRDRRITNTVVLTGDIHSNWVADLKPDFDDPKSPVVGTEFVGTSISSGGDGADSLPRVEAYLVDNPHIRFYNSQRGYVRCVVTPDRWRTDYRVVDYVTTPGAPIKTRATFVVEKNRPGAQKA